MKISVVPKEGFIDSEIAKDYTKKPFKTNNIDIFLEESFSAN
jgi:hypothetical protein